VRNNGELEMELKGVTDDNAELRSSLANAEAAVSELRARLKSSQHGDESRLREIEALQSHIETLQRKASGSEIELEKSSSTIMRLRTENNGLETVRRTLEAELARCRDELHEYHAQPTQSKESVQLSYELEKILVAIGSTLDQFSSGSSDGKKLEETASAIVSKADVAIASRVDFVLRRLGDLRSWAREELRGKRSLEEKCVDLGKDLTAMQLRSSESLNTLKAELRAAVEKEIVLQEKVNSYSRIETDLKRKNDEVEKLVNSLRQVTLQLEDSKVSCHKYATENQAKSLELERVADKLRIKEDESSKMYEKLIASNDKVEVLMQEMASCDPESLSIMIPVNGYKLH
jgi:chromosome segregation ATPase